MTNLVISVIAVLTTNWTTVSRTTPIYHDPPGAQFAVMRYDTLNQVGTVVTNWVALVPWRGKTNSIVLESVEAAGAPRQERNILESPFQISP